MAIHILVYLLKIGLANVYFCCVMLQDQVMWISNAKGLCNDEDCVRDRRILLLVQFMDIDYICGDCVALDLDNIQPFHNNCSKTYVCELGAWLG